MSLLTHWKCDIELGNAVGVRSASEFHESNRICTLRTNVCDSKGVPGVEDLSSFCTELMTDFEQSGALHDSRFSDVNRAYPRPRCSGRSCFWVQVAAWRAFSCSSSASIWLILPSRKDARIRISLGSPQLETLTCFTDSMERGVVKSWALASCICSTERLWLSCHGHRILIWALRKERLKSKRDLRIYRKWRKIHQMNDGPERRKGITNACVTKMNSIVNIGSRDWSYYNQYSAPRHQSRIGSPVMSNWG